MQAVLKPLVLQNCSNSALLKEDEKWVRIGCKTRFTTDLCEAEDIVNEEQHILTLSITEVLSNSQPCKGT